MCVTLNIINLGSIYQSAQVDGSFISEVIAQGSNKDSFCSDNIISMDLSSREEKSPSDEKLITLMLLFLSSPRI